MTDTPQPEHGRAADRRPVNVLWMTSGLGCDGESLAMTSATNPSLEDLLRGCLPGMPPVILHNPVLAYENGDDFMSAWHEAAAGRLDPFILVLEGSVPNEEINGDGHWSGLGTDPQTGQPILTNTWIDRLAPNAAAVLALGTCAAYGGIPAMRNNPTGAMGLRDYLGWNWKSRRGIPIINLPGCPVQPDNITETLLCIVLHLAQMAPLATDRRAGTAQTNLRPHRARELQPRRDGRAGPVLQRARRRADCLVKLGCKGPVVKCNVPIRGWTNGIGGCPNVGGICIACTMPGFPDKYIPFVDPDTAALAYARTAKYIHGPVIRFLRERRIRHTFDVEPEWRRPGKELASGYRAR